MISTCLLQHPHHSGSQTHWACLVWAGTSSSASPRSSWRWRRWRGAVFHHLGHYPGRKCYNMNQSPIVGEHCYCKTCIVWVLPLPVTPYVNKSPFFPWGNWLLLSSHISQEVCKQCTIRIPFINDISRCEPGAGRQREAYQLDRRRRPDQPLCRKHLWGQSVTRQWPRGCG